VLWCAYLCYRRPVQFWRRHMLRRGEGKPIVQGDQPPLLQCRKLVLALKVLIQAVDCMLMLAAYKNLVHRDGGKHC
jgi:hypothetical protein